ncbi:hypothetical protein ACFS2C_23540 [Prauserella oleivorans]|uniref:Uncharacterized protein n=1 Tax=Prauserella oleivorans TaxID=1478153 RepID=A0ABW5WEZ0_9PSEU
MNARITVGDPGAAHSAKNTTAPGLPNQTANDSKGRTPMVAQQDIVAETAERGEAR